MRLIPASYNSFNLQQGSAGSEVVATTFPMDNPYDWNILGLSTNKLPRENDFPVFTSKNYDGSFKTLEIWIGDIDQKHNEMVIAMDVLGDGQHQLISLDEYGNEWYVNAVCLGKSTESLDANDVNKGNFTWIFETDDPIWKKLIPTHKTLSISGSGSVAITPIGDIQALPIITITPTGGAFGFAYQRFIQIINNSQFALNNYPINLNGAGLDTAALVADNANKALLNGAINAVVTTITYDTVTGTIPAAGMAYVGTEQITYTSKSGTQLLGVTRGVNGTTAAVHADNDPIFVSKMAADGNDLRIYVDGVEVKRWLQGMNTTTTKIWINHSAPANSNMTLGAAIAGAGSITTITIANTAANNTALPLIPTSGFVLIGTEVFVYTGVNVASRLLTGVTRASRQTSAGAHVITDTIKFITHDVWMYYGNANISAYVVDDTYKPIIKLTSTNTNWIYEEFGNFAATRTGGWLFGLLQSLVEWSTGTGIQFGIDPFTAIGLRNSVDPNTGYGLLGKGAWNLFQPCGVTTITVTGKKHRSGLFMYTTFTFETSVNNTLWVTQWTEASPAVLTDADLDLHNAVALGATYYFLRFVCNNQLTYAQRSDMEVRDISAMAIDSTKVPTITIATEQSIINLHSVFTNSANGLTMTLDLVMTSGQILTVNTKERTITLQDGSNQINSLIDMPVRQFWFPFEPNVLNTIGVTDAGVVDYTFDFEDRGM